MERINYVVNGWVGARRNGDTKLYILDHVESLTRLKHGLTQITIVMPYHENLFSPEIVELRKLRSIQSTPVVVMVRENKGISYGSFSHAYLTYLDSFDYYVFIEDDYVFVKDYFDYFLVEMMKARPSCGYLCGLVLEPPASPFEKHGAIANGIAREGALRKVLARHGKLPYYDSMACPDLIRSQIEFTNCCMREGYTLEDMTDRYSALFRCDIRGVVNLGTCADSLIEPIEGK